MYSDFKENRMNSEKIIYLTVSSKQVRNYHFALQLQSSGFVFLTCNIHAFEL